MDEATRLQKSACELYGELTGIYARAGELRWRNNRLIQGEPAIVANLACEAIREAMQHLEWLGSSDRESEPNESEAARG